jgi:hypothetical protein
MNEKELLLIRLEDLSESSENKEVRTLAKALQRFYKSKEPMGFTSDDSKKDDRNES